LAARLVAVLGEHGRGALPLDDLLARSHVAAGERGVARRTLRALVARGTVVETRAHEYALAARQHLRSGEVQVHPDGYAFLIERREPVGSAPAAKPAARGRRTTGRDA